MPSRARCRQTRYLHRHTIGNVFRSPKRTQERERTYDGGRRQTAFAGRAPIQTAALWLDLCINTGNDGGPLFHAQGNVVGVVMAKLAASG